jgi:hypothetical protein
MSSPWIPSYLGSYENLIHSLLDNPFLGGGSDRRQRVRLAVSAPDVIDDHPPFPLRRTEPSPSPWSPAVSFVMSAISLKEVASTLPDGQLRNDLGKRADHAISMFIDDICPRPPRIRWPWPGPPPWAYAIVTELALAANSFQEGRLRQDLLHVAGQLAQRAFGDIGKLQQE